MYELLCWAKTVGNEDGHQETCSELQENVEENNLSGFR